MDKAMSSSDYSELFSIKIDNNISLLNHVETDIHKIMQSIHLTEQDTAIMLSVLKVIRDVRHNILETEE